MANINIAGTTPVEDPSYRYKMPRIIPKVEGRGNGIKTVLVNITDVASALNREPVEITKYFGFELGAQTIYSDDDRAVVNGAHTANDLQHHISRYIEFFVLCKECRLPETHYKIKGGVIYQKCLACGAKSACDMTNKLSTFIVKQHSKKDGKDKKKDKKKSKDREESEEKSDAKAAEKAEKKEKKAKKKKEAALEVEEEGPVEEETIETDSEAIDAAIVQFSNWFREQTNPSTTAVLEELRNIQTMCALKTFHRILIFIGAVFTSESIVSNDIEKHTDFLKLLAGSTIQQRQLISACEWFCGTYKPDLLRYYPVMLKQLYDCDLVEEDVFYSWASDYSRNEYSVDSSMITIDTLDKLKEAAQPFITWLHEAEEEEDDDEEDA